jgi:hypothetical protein
VHVGTFEGRRPANLTFGDGLEKRSDMSSKTRQYAAGSGSKGHAKAVARKRARQTYGRSQGFPWFKIGVGSFAVVIIAILGFSFVTSPPGNSGTTGYGKLSAQSTNYDFGDVPWRGGFVTTQFPLTVEGDVTVKDIVST